MGGGGVQRPHPMDYGSGKFGHGRGGKERVLNNSTQFFISLVPSTFTSLALITPTIHGPNMRMKGILCYLPADRNWYIFNLILRNFRNRNKKFSSGSYYIFLKKVQLYIEICFCESVIAKMPYLRKCTVTSDSLSVFRLKFRSLAVFLFLLF